MLDLFLNLFIFYREYDFYTAIQISRHPVCTSHIDLFMSAILEIEDPAVLQEILLQWNAHGYFH